MTASMLVQSRRPSRRQRRRVTRRLAALAAVTRMFGDSRPLVPVRHAAVRAS